MPKRSNPLADAMMQLLAGLEEIEAKLTPPEALISKNTTFRQWCKELADQGLKVDGKPFRLDNRPALQPIYDAIPSTQEEAHQRILVIMKATQLGLTIWEVLAVLYMAIKWGPINIGLFLPDQQTAIKKSEHRFMRMVRSAPPLYQLLTDGKVAGKPKEGNVLTRTIRESILMFLWTSGKVTTESMPMDVVTFDEVQEMRLDAMDKAIARTGDSDIQFAVLLSTANMPNLDIDWWYRQGTQEVWHTECPACHKLSDLSDPAIYFPDKSIRYQSGRYVWACPECGSEIADPQQGRYICTRPDMGNAPAPQIETGDETPEDETRRGLEHRQIRSFLLPRTISPKITPRMMMEGYLRADTPDRKKSFYNRTLARPFLDANQQPVSMAHCLAAAEAGMKRGLLWKKRGRDCLMGIDQMGGFNAVIIKERLPDGKQGVVHVEAIFNDDPFARCSELMDIYGVACCVVENLPNFNDARRFANSHPGRVFIVTSHGLKGDMIQWGDDLSKNDKRTAQDDRSRYSVAISQYQAMQTALYRIRDQFCLFPDPAKLEQEVIDKGRKKIIALLRDWVFVHFTKTALVVEEDPDERKPRAKVLKVGIDPHYAYANMLCDVAWSRNWGTGSFVLPDEVSPLQPAPTSQPTAKSIVSVLGINQAGRGKICGQCSGFKDGFCYTRAFNVGDDDLACPLYS
jgi:hypothetical protein